MNDAEIKTIAAAKCAEIDVAQKTVRNLLMGRKVRIIDKNFNGQPYGSSKPSLCGKEYTINWVATESYGVFVSFKHYSGNASIEISKIEFIGEN